MIYTTLPTFCVFHSQGATRAITDSITKWRCVEGYDPYHQNVPLASLSGASRLHDGSGSSPVSPYTDSLSPTTTMQGPHSPSRPHLSRSTSIPMKDSEAYGAETCSAGAGVVPQNRRSLLCNWWQEIASVTLAIVFIVAIIAILLRIDGK